MSGVGCTNVIKWSFTSMYAAIVESSGQVKSYARRLCLITEQTVIDALPSHDLQAFVTCPRVYTH